MQLYCSIANGFYCCHLTYIFQILLYFMLQIPHINYDETTTGYWEWQKSDKSSCYSPALKTMLGYSADDIVEDYSSFRKLIHPNYLKTIHQKFLKHIASHGRIPFVVEAELYHKNGSLLFLLFTGKVDEWEGGLPVKMTGSYINITYHKQAELQLVQARNFLDKTNQAAKVGGWELDLLTDKLTWTKVTKAIFEVPEDFVPPRGASLAYFNEHDGNILQREVTRAITEGTPYKLDLKITTAKGNECWTRTTGYPEFTDGVCTKLYGTFQDISEQKRNEDALELKQAQLVAFIEYSPVAIVMFDKQLRYIAASAVWRNEFGINDSDLVGKGHDELFPALPERWNTYLKQCLAGDALSKEEDFFIVNGKKVWIQWEMHPWFEKSGEVGGVISFTDFITEKREATFALIKAKRVAEDAARAKVNFLSIMSHEIRTPMNAVIGFTNLLLQDPRTDQLDNLNMLKFSAENLLVIINDILDFNRIDTGKVKFENIDFNLPQLIENIRMTQQQEADRKDLRLDLAIDNNLPLIIKGDPVRLGQIITNLVGNGIKFTPEGSVMISLKLVSENEHEIKILFEVTDTGIGIPIEKQKYIFEMFSQADVKVSRTYGGTGLGLAICKRLLDTVNSAIKVESKPGEGSRFFFELAFDKSVTTAEAFNNIPEALPLANLTGKKILITEDNPINVMVVKKFLQQWQVICDVAENGKIALEKVQVNDYDLILMDLQMPVMDGYEATIQIRALPHDKYRKLPIVALTASVVSGLDEKILNCGIDDFVNKPFKPNELHAKILMYMNRAEG